MSGVNRAPAIRRHHPADDLPERPTRPAAAAPTPSPPVQPAEAPPLAAPDVRQAGGEVEKMTEQHNVRIRPSVKARAVRAVGKLRYETGNKDVSLQSITDAALDEYLRKHGC